MRTVSRGPSSLSDDQLPCNPEHWRVGTLRHLELLCGARTHRLAQEGFEHEQRPERNTVIANTRLMIVDHVAQKSWIEISGAHQYRTENGGLYALSQRSAEPAAEPHGKPHLRAVQNL